MNWSPGQPFAFLFISIAALITILTTLFVLLRRLIGKCFRQKRPLRGFQLLNKLQENILFYKTQLFNCVGKKSIKFLIKGTSCSPAWHSKKRQVASSQSCLSLLPPIAKIHVEQICLAGRRYNVYPDKTFQIGSFFPHKRHFTQVKTSHCVQVVKTHKSSAGIVQLFG